MRTKQKNTQPIEIDEPTNAAIIEVYFLPSVTLANMESVDKVLGTLFDEFHVKKTLKLEKVNKRYRGMIVSSETFLGHLGDFLDVCDEVQNYSISLLYRVKKKTIDML